MKIKRIFSSLLIVLLVGVLASSAVFATAQTSENTTNTASSTEAAAQTQTESAEASTPKTDENQEEQPEEDTPSVVYKTHVQNIGTQPEVSDGELAGTTGKGLRVEAFWVRLKNNGIANGGISYRVHVQNIGWQSSVSAGTMAGTSGRSLQIEAIEIHLTDKTLADQYDIYYRVHVQNIGWLNWAKDGEYAGTIGRSLRIEGLQIELVKKGAQVNDPLHTASALQTPYLGYLVEGQTHVQNVGWQRQHNENQIFGTKGRALRLEALQLKLTNLQNLGMTGNIEYQAHVQNIGWQGNVWKKNGENAGTSGRSLRVEAVRIRLSGEIAKHFDVYYRVHVQGYGWLDWAKNGETAGTYSLSRRMEALQIVIEPKGISPGVTYVPYVSNARSKTIKIARSQIGYHAGNNKYTKYGVWYNQYLGAQRKWDFSHENWCFMFVSWCGEAAGAPSNFMRNAYVPSAVQWYQTRGCWHWRGSYRPKTGDLVIFDWNGDKVVDHIGFVESIKHNDLITIEGNSRSQVRRVNRGNYQTSTDIFGYADPRY
ncbi:MAG: CHAP domain-containing protein [Eubacteriaceae bacterium]|uniref:CHAP domain-containing protein n=1 Tax=Candidatus Pseudoramibacter fermentans TaxID=2594427 RepID=A0A6L5GTU9_9FIRM|nr:CHAP domain-containing protein [Candidatus Pseudoramibacter fermentans]RRF92783.1 MAG: CHAP domain-containing protein [Eubacteriaceae bacterium]